MKTLLLIITILLTSCKIEEVDDTPACTSGGDHTYDKWEKVSNDGYLDWVEVQRRTCIHCGWSQRIVDGAE